MTTIPLITPILFGLWSWLFTSNLTNEGEIFHFVNLKYSEQNKGADLLRYKYTNCAVCHAGLWALGYTIFRTIGHSLTLDGLTVITATVSVVGTFLATLFVSATVAMTVANWMSIKY